MVTKLRTDRFTQEFDFEKDMYEYQEDDAQEIAKYDGNFMVLSEMGTGKTPTVMRAVNIAGYKSCLILCPKNLRLEWDRQIKQWYGLAPVVCNKGTRKRLEPLFESMTDKKEYAPYFILNYDSFRSSVVFEVLEMFQFECIIMDEVHQMRNADSKTSVAMMKFLEKQPEAKIITMTGSPIVNSTLDLYTILSIVRPAYHDKKNIWEFLNKFTYWTAGRRKPTIFGLKDADGLSNYIEPFSIRRLKKECLKWLPEKFNHPVALEMDDDQQAAYDQMQEEMFVMLDEGEEITAGGVLAKITRLRQLNLDPRILGLKSGSSKTEFLLEAIQGIDGKFVIGSTFATYCRLLGDDLEKLGIKSVQLTGKSLQASELKFHEDVKRFQEDDETKVALITMKMGQGLTLTRSSIVALADRWWTPTANNQVIDRLHRPGQESPVEILLPSNDKSIDVSMDIVCASKLGLSDSLLNETTVIRETIEDMRRFRK